ncbi:hypothetical protein YC2023_025463 [Brassica napus]
MRAAGAGEHKNWLGTVTDNDLRQECQKHHNCIKTCLVFSFDLVLHGLQFATISDVVRLINWSSILHTCMNHTNTTKKTNQSTPDFAIMKMENYLREREKERDGNTRGQKEALVQLGNFQYKAYYFLICACGWAFLLWSQSMYTYMSSILATIVHTIDITVESAASPIRILKLGHVLPSSPSRIHVSRGQRVTTASYHHRRPNHRIHRPNPELHSSVTLHLEPSLRILDRRESIAEARSHPSPERSRRRKAVEAFTSRKLKPKTPELKKLPRRGDKDRRRRICESLRLPDMLLETQRFLSEKNKCSGGGTDAHAPADRRAPSQIYFLSLSLSSPIPFFHPNYIEIINKNLPPPTTKQAFMSEILKNEIVV